jgi:hypothetical protein
MAGMTTFPLRAREDRAPGAARQSLVLAGLGTAAAVLVYAAGDRPFRRFLGDVDPLAAAALIGFLGVALFSAVLGRRGFTISGKGNVSELLRSSGAAALLASIAILIDLVIGFPADLNVPLPGALAFYPAIGFFVEVLFHLVPLSLLLFGATAIFGGVGRGRLVWACVVIVALLEPGYQAALMASSKLYPSWAVACVGLNVFLFNLLQLRTFERYDFVSMYALRIAYYAVWHVLWGSLRLKWLFQ